jgi:hypothetical protein
MNPMLLGSLFEFGGKLLDRFFPDAEKRREAEAEFLKMAAEAEFKQTLAQLEINAREAAHPSLFVSGGRPLFLWVGGVGFAYATIIQPILAWIAAIKGYPMPPNINVDLLWVVVTGLLGISGLRSMDKAKGVASK